MRNKLLLAAGAMLAICVACDVRTSPPPVAVAGGDAQRGKAAIAHFGCGSCHTIEGISGAVGLVGPPLTGIGARQFVGGVLPNTPQNMIRWISDPHAVDDKTAMPSLGVPGKDAADIASYLYSTR